MVFNKFFFMILSLTAAKMIFSLGPFLRQNNFFGFIDFQFAFLKVKVNTVVILFINTKSFTEIVK